MVGQIVFTTNIASEGSIAQGVQQTYDSETLNNTESTFENFEMVISTISVRTFHPRFVQCELFKTEILV